MTTFGAPPPAAAGARPSVLTKLVVPIAAAVIVTTAIFLFFSSFLPESGPLLAGSIFGVAVFVIGRALAFWDTPKRWGAPAGHLATGLFVGMMGTGLLDSIFEMGGAGVWGILAGAGWGLMRAHKPVLELSRKEPDRGRLWGLFDRRELVALGMLVGGYALMGLGLYSLFAIFARFIPEAGRVLAIGAAAYALAGLRRLLAFASHEQAAVAPGFLGWFKANFLRNAIVLVVLVGYLVLRDDLARALPFFPLIEFGLGMAVFGFVLARLRAHMKRLGSDHATASAATPHEQKVEPRTEREFEDVARPIAQFVETGRNRGDYARTMRESVGDDARADDVLAPLRTHQEPIPIPVLPLPWAVGASLATGGLLGAALASFLLVIAGAPVSAAVGAALGVVGLSVFRLQDTYRQYLVVWGSFGIAAAGTGILLVAFFVFLLATGVPLALVPGLVWGIAGVIAAALVGFSLPPTLRLRKRLAQGPEAFPPRATPEAELLESQKKARARVSGPVGAALALLLFAGPLLRYLANRDIIPDELVTFLGEFSLPLGIVLAAFAAGGLVRFGGLDRARPAVLARYQADRARRLHLHRQIMGRMERV